MFGPGWLVVGSRQDRAERVELAAAVLRRLAPGRRIAGVMVTTTAADGAGGLPAGGYSLLEDEQPEPGTAPFAMRQAGAQRVLSLRSHPDALAAGFAAAVARLGPGALVVAASNALRRVVDPDLFLMVGRPGDAAAWPAAGEVAHLVDRWVDRRAAAAELAPAGLAVAGGRWILPEPATAIVLAGGQSRRMGVDKRFLRLHDRPLLERVVATLRPLVGEVVIGANDPELGRSLGLRTIADRVPGEGPLMALASALEATTSDRNLLVACDLPEIPASLVTALLAAALTAEAVVPVGADGLREPLLAVYRRRLLGDANALLAGGERRLWWLAEGCRTAFLELSRFGIDRLPNLNTRDDFERYLEGGDPAR
ncbi:MAG TPA: molybdenum cofactor guanylyltransferase [Thermoanaerobaculales bacterium]|nr:molybdenum cofactor guanylyltransferase [Thermoanaerobaculales bacterium]HPA79742.1 molybdenum cofactor guanylyltransferase [Thermoanaerobaculales bacterium]HQN96074.1 molybdenum cofactor guanylyltransferase [Thermoanaerobaculales bacterium]